MSIVNLVVSPQDSATVLCRDVRTEVGVFSKHLRNIILADVAKVKV
jgi:hypothetical protein